MSKINDNRYLSFDHYQYDEFNVIATKLKEQADTIRKTLKTLKNERLKINVKAYYDRCLTPKSFEGITRQEFEKLKQLGLDKIVFDRHRHAF